jgi:hypothetical protein
VSRTVAFRIPHVRVANAGRATPAASVKENHQRAAIIILSIAAFNLTGTTICVRRRLLLVLLLLLLLLSEPTTRRDVDKSTGLKTSIEIPCRNSLFK